MKNWVTDERTHAMWCANLIKYPLCEEHMAETMTAAADRFGDGPYVVISDDGRVEGFFCYSYNNETKEGILYLDDIITNRYRIERNCYHEYCSYI